VRRAGKESSEGASDTVQEGIAVKTCSSVYGSLGGRFLGSALLVGAFIAPGWAAQAQPLSEAGSPVEIDTASPNALSGDAASGTVPPMVDLPSPVEAAPSSPSRPPSGEGLQPDVDPISEAPAQLTPEPMPGSPL
jgi:hypothetical protein